jgi:hypothetical protein
LSTNNSGHLVRRAHSIPIWVLNYFELLPANRIPLTIRDVLIAAGTKKWPHDNNAVKRI